jgi:hypothetical protein
MTRVKGSSTTVVMEDFLFLLADSLMGQTMNLRQYPNQKKKIVKMESATLISQIRT